MQMGRILNSGCRLWGSCNKLEDWQDQDCFSHVIFSFKIKNRIIQKKKKRGNDSWIACGEVL